MNRTSWLAACSALAVAAATSAQAIPIKPSVDVDNARTVAAIREALLKTQPSMPGPDALIPGAPLRLAQWGNWGNWGNWNNWQNWGNWGNWGNY